MTIQPFDYSAVRTEMPNGSNAQHGAKESAPEIFHARRTAADVLGFKIDATTWELAIARISAWAHRRDSRAIYLCNVHSLVTARGDAAIAHAVHKADLALPDGAPIAWALRGEGFTAQQRLSGPDLMLRVLDAAQSAGHVVTFFGSNPEMLEDLCASLGQAYPALKIGAMISPPFRSLTEQEDTAYVAQINSVGTQILFVGLGCPKQELWIHDHCGKVQAPMIGVGAAFAFHSGAVKRAPLWMQHNGLEWLHRLAKEPRRLAWRYIHTNTVFLGLTLKKWLLAPLRR